jgi:hypothetical protein
MAMHQARTVLLDFNGLMPRSKTPVSTGIMDFRWIKGCRLSIERMRRPEI